MLAGLRRSLARHDGAKAQSSGNDVGGDVMGIRLFVLLLASLPAIVQTQTALPPDINPVTLSRLPPVTPEDLDEEGRKLLAQSPQAKPGPGPGHLTSYSPRDRSLGIPTGVGSPVGP